MTAPSSSPDARPRKPFAWWRVPLLWVLIALMGAVVAASVATVWIAHHAADTELQAPDRVIHIGPPRAAGTGAAAPTPGAAPTARDGQ